MTSTSQEPKGRDGAFSTLNVAIEALNLAKEVSSITPAKAVFGSVSILLTMIKDSMANEQNYVDLGMNCNDVCKALDRGLNGRRLDELSLSVLEAITQFTTTVAAIQKKIIKQGKRKAVSRIFHAKHDKDTIAGWRQDLIRILHIFSIELAINTNIKITDTNIIVADIRRNQEGQPVLHPRNTPLGELPPPAPRTCFGRDELIEKLVGFAENLEPVALIGAGGIGKTSIALTVLHHKRIKDRFGEQRRFIRCDQFPASRPHFLARLSKVIGAGIENPEDLITLRPFLSSKNMFIILDNAESVLDPQGTDAREIYGIMDELCQFETICVCITSRLTTVPRHCKLPEIPTLSIEAARDMFYSIHSNDGQQSPIIDDLLCRLDFHALSITLLATTACHNKWDYDELAKEWEIHRALVLRTDYNESLAATIELSLASPTFRKLGDDARNLLGVVAFFPQGVDERNLDSFFPGIADRKDIFRNFRVLSLTHRSNGFITMLAPIRDYLCLPDPKTSPLLSAVKDCYFSWLSVYLYPGKGFEEGKWIRCEDVNVEHLLNVFTGTSIDTTTDDVWHACACFMDHLFWHKNRRTVLGSKINGLPDDHPSKPECLFRLSKLFAGNYAEQKRLLSHALRLYRERGNDSWVAFTLRNLSETNRMLRLYEEGIQQMQEALEIFERLDRTVEQAKSLVNMAFLLYSDQQLDAAEEATSRAMKLLPEEGEELNVCQSHRLLGDICISKGERETAIHHFETALRVASTFNWHGQLFWVHYSMARLFLDKDELGDAQTHIEQAKSHAVESTDDLLIGDAMMVQALIWFRQSRLEDSRSETLGVLEIYEKLGAERAGGCRDFLQEIEQAIQFQ